MEPKIGDILYYFYVGLDETQPIVPCEITEIIHSANEKYLLIYAISLLNSEILRFTLRKDFWDLDFDHAIYGPFTFWIGLNFEKVAEQYKKVLNDNN